MIPPDGQTGLAKGPDWGVGIQVSRESGVRRLHTWPLFPDAPVIPSHVSCRPTVPRREP